MIRRKYVSPISAGLQRTIQEKRKHRGDLVGVLICAQGGVDVGEDAEDLVEAGDFENGADWFLQTGEGEFSSVFLDVLHAFDQSGQTGTVDVADAGKIDNQLLGLFLGHHLERGGDVGRDVQVDLAFQRENIRLIFARHRAGGGHGFFHQFPIVNRLPSDRVNETIDI
jgi:hypothetical protein